MTIQQKVVDKVVEKIRTEMANSDRADKWRYKWHWLDDDGHPVGIKVWNDDKKSVTVIETSKFSDGIRIQTLINGTKQKFDDSHSQWPGHKAAIVTTDDLLESLYLGEWSRTSGGGLSSITLYDRLIEGMAAIYNKEPEDIEAMPAIGKLQYVEGDKKGNTTKAAEIKRYMADPKFQKWLADSGKVKKASLDDLIQPAPEK